MSKSKSFFSKISYIIAPISVVSYGCNTNNENPKTVVQQLAPVSLVDQMCSALQSGKLEEALDITGIDHLVPAAKKKIIDAFIPGLTTCINNIESDEKNLVLLEQYLNIASKLGIYSEINVAASFEDKLKTFINNILEKKNSRDDFNKLQKIDQYLPGKSMIKNIIENYVKTKIQTVLSTLTSTKESLDNLANLVHLVTSSAFEINFSEAITAALTSVKASNIKPYEEGIASNVESLVLFINNLLANNFFKDPAKTILVQAISNSCVLSSASASSLQEIIALLNDFSRLDVTLNQLKIINDEALNTKITALQNILNSSDEVLGKFIKAATATMESQFLSNDKTAIERVNNLYYEIQNNTDAEFKKLREKDNVKSAIEEYTKKVEENIVSSYSNLITDFKGDNYFKKYNNGDSAWSKLVKKILIVQDVFGDASNRFIEAINEGRAELNTGFLNSFNRLKEKAEEAIKSESLIDLHNMNAILTDYVHLQFLKTTVKVTYEPEELRNITAAQWLKVHMKILYNNNRGDKTVQSNIEYIPTLFALSKYIAKESGNDQFNFKVDALQFESISKGGEFGTRLNDVFVELENVELLQKQDEIPSVPDKKEMCKNIKVYNIDAREHKGMSDEQAAKHIAAYEKFVEANANYIKEAFKNEQIFTKYCKDDAKKHVAEGAKCSEFVAEHAKGLVVKTKEILEKLRSADINTEENKLKIFYDAFAAIFACWTTTESADAYLRTRGYIDNGKGGSNTGESNFGLSKAKMSAFLEKTVRMKPHFLQVVMSALVLSEIKKENDAFILPKQLSQMSTGEGKSIVILAIAIIASYMLDVDVNVACYSLNLSERDKADAKILMDFLGIDESKIKYNTLHRLSEDIMSEKTGDPRRIVHNSLLGEKHAKSSGIDGKKSGRKTLLILDEVDVVRDAVGNPVAPVVYYNDKSGNLEKIMKHIFDSVKVGVSGSDTDSLKPTEAIRKEVIETSDYKNFIEVLKARFKDEAEKEKLELAIVKEIDAMCAAAKIVKGLKDKEGYKIVTSKAFFPKEDNKKEVESKAILAVAYKDLFKADQTYFGRGYETPMLFMKEIKNANDDERKQKLELGLKVYSGLMLNCGKFSYSKMLAMFDSVFGISGTIEALPDESRDLLHNVLGVEQCKIGPSYYAKILLDNGKEIKREISFSYKNSDNKEIKIDTETKHIEAIVVKAIEQAKNGCSVILYHNSEEFLDKVRVTLEKCSEVTNHEVALNDTMYADLDQNDYKKCVADAARRSTITLSSMAHSRGTDYKVTDQEVIKAGGISLILPELIVDMSEWIQICGRTGRQGNSGSIFMIYNTEELESKYGITDDEIRNEPKKLKDCPDKNNYMPFEETVKKISKRDEYKYSNTIGQINEDHESSTKVMEKYKDDNIKLDEDFLNMTLNLDKKLGNTRLVAILVDRTSYMKEALEQISKKMPEITQYIINTYGESAKIDIVGYTKIEEGKENIEFADHTGFEKLGSYEDVIGPKGPTCSNVGILPALFMACMENAVYGLKDIILYGNSGCKQGNDMLDINGKLGGNYSNCPDFTEEGVQFLTTKDNDISKDNYKDIIKNKKLRFNNTELEGKIQPLKIQLPTSEKTLFNEAIKCPKFEEIFKVDSNDNINLLYSKLKKYMQAMNMKVTAIRAEQCKDAVSVTELDQFDIIASDTGGELHTFKKGKSQKENFDILYGILKNMLRPDLSTIRRD